MESYSIDLTTGMYTSSKSKERTALGTSIAEIYKCNSCHLFSSGLNAIYIVLAVLAQHYKNGTFIVSKHMYQPTLKKTISLLRKQYPSINFQITDFYQNNKIKKTFQNPDIKVLFFEWCSNPNGYMFDPNILTLIPPNTYVVVDNTWLTPFLLNPFDYQSVSCVIESTAKYWSSGHIPAGFATFRSNDHITFGVQQMISALGIHVSRLYSNFLQENISNISERIQIASDRMVQLIPRLKNHPQILKVDYPTIVNPPVILIYIKCASLPSREQVKRWAETNNFVFITSYGHKFDSIDSYPFITNDYVRIRLSLGYEGNIDYITNIMNFIDMVI